MAEDGLHHYLMMQWQSNPATQRLHSSFSQFSRQHLAQHGLLGYLKHIYQHELSPAGTLELAYYLLKRQHTRPEDMSQVMTQLSQQHAFTFSPWVNTWDPACWRVLRDHRDD